MGSVDFHMDSKVIGAFPGGELSMIDGSYRYEPYRSPGHLNLHRELRAGKTPRCFCQAGELCISFSVTASPTQGVLSLMGIEVEALQNRHAQEFRPRTRCRDLSNAKIVLKAPCSPRSVTAPAKIGGTATNDVQALELMVPEKGLEPSTRALRMRCSTN